MKRKILALLLAGTMVFGQMPAVFGAEEYTDFTAVEEDELGEDVEETADEDYLEFNAEETADEAAGSFEEELIYEEEEEFFNEEYEETLAVDENLVEFADEYEDIETVLAGDEGITPVYEYDFPQGGDYLPYWGDNIGAVEVWVEDDEHPEGEKFFLEITNIEIAEGDKDAINLIHDGDWKFETKKFGTVTLKCYYTDLDGSEKSFNYYINVIDEVYQCNVRSRDNLDKALPGGNFELYTEISHQYMDGDDHRDADTSSVTWSYKMTKGNEIAELTVNKDGTATVNVADVIPDGADTDIRVEAIFFDQGKEVGAGYINLFVKDSYLELYPYSVDGKLGFGKSLIFEPELREYPGKNGAEYDIVKNTRVVFEYDEKNLEIKDEKGAKVPDESDSEWNELMGTIPQKFTIRRLTLEDIDFNVRMQYQREDGAWEDGDDRNYCFDDMWYDLDFDMHDRNVYVGEDVEIKIDGVEDALAAGYDLEWKVGKWEKTYDPEDEGLWLKTIKEGNGWSYSNGIVTVDTDAIYKQDVDDIRVLLEGSCGGERIFRTDTWVHLQNAEEEYDITWFDGSQYVIGWDEFISKQGTAYVRDKDHPFGIEVPYEINDVKIAENNPLEDGNEVFALEKEEGGWTIKAQNVGNALFEAKFTSIYGDERTAQFKAYSAEEFWVVDILEDAPDMSVLPGQTFNLWTKVRYFGYSSEEKKLTYTWSVKEGTDAFSVAPDPSDPSKAKVTVSKNAQYGPEGIILVSLKLEDGSEVAASQIDYRVSDNYNGIIPNNLDSNFKYPTDVTTFEPKVERGFIDDDGEIKTQIFKDQVFRFDYNPSVVKITDASGAVVESNKAYAGPFTLEILNNAGDRIQVFAYDKNNLDSENAWRFYFIYSVDRNELVEFASGLIKAIPEKVTASDEDAIKKAKKCYDSMLDDEKVMIDSTLVTKLNKAVTDVAQAVKDKEAADVVTGRINALPANPGVNDEKTVSEVAKAYNDLLPAQKQYVPADAVTKLTNAQSSVAAAKKKAEDDAKKKAEEDAKKKATEEKATNITFTPTTAKKGKKTVIKVTADSGAKLAVTATNKNAKNKKFVKIKNGTTAKLTFTKKAKKGAYKFSVSAPKNGQYKAATKVITIKVK